MPEFDVRPPDRQNEFLEQSWGKSMLVYFGTLAAGLGLSYVGMVVLHVNPLRTVTFICGAVYLLAGIGWPRPLYLTLRRMRWFGDIENPRTMHTIMLVISVLLFLTGLLLPGHLSVDGNWR